MATGEPGTTAVLLVTLGLLLAVSALASRVAGRVGLPLSLLFLLVGMLAGSEGLGGIAFENYPLTFRLGTAALVLILFDGGFSTNLREVRGAVAPALVLATAGVLVTAGVTALGAYLLGLPWRSALLFGTVVSATDAAAVFSVLRGGRQPQKRVASLLELESGLNDPMAVILTITLIQIQQGGSVSVPRVIVSMFIEMAVGGAAGIALGRGGRWLLARAKLPTRGLYPVLTLALALLGFGMPTLAHGSGFLAVYLTGLVLGNGRVPDRAGVARVHDSIAWLSQIGMFLLLGLLVYPSRLLAVAPTAIGVALVLGLLARPLAVMACLAPFRYARRELLYIGWVGLRGAMPIILATFPVLARVPGSELLFNLVFFVVVVNSLVPGLTVRWVTGRLGLESNEPPAPHALLEITSTESLHGEVCSFYIEPASAASGAAIVDLPFPEGTAVMLVIRGQDLIAPRGPTVLVPGDHVYVFCRPEDKPLVQLLLGRPEEE
ncbi:MAG TPA: potassium/proton antiporter [Polyangia bacterium]|nr:potassium/proton antiporter [Polyangia bacterium]